MARVISADENSISEHMEGPYATSDAEMPANVPEGSRLRRIKLIAATLCITIVLVLATIGYYVFFHGTDDGPMTMTELMDKMIDTNGDRFPDQYGPYDEGDNVTVRDRLSGYGYSGSPPEIRHTLTFSYTGDKWRDVLHNIWAYIRANVSMCSYGEGDWITLVGTVVVYEWDNRTYEWMDWSFAEELEGFEVPAMELNLTWLYNSWQVKISGCNEECRLSHFKFLLRRYGFGWDMIDQTTHGRRSNHMEFWDADRNGCLSDGDYLFVMLTQEGDYEVAVFYHNAELDQVSWMYDP